MQLLEKTKENEQMVRDRSTFLEQKVEERTHAFRKAMQKSDDLLLNILPEPIANELKEYGKTKEKTYGVKSSFTHLIIALRFCWSGDQQRREAISSEGYEPIFYTFKALYSTTVFRNMSNARSA